jgi:hypothetical protein
VQPVLARTVDDSSGQKMETIELRCESRVHFPFRYAEPSLAALTHDSKIAFSFTTANQRGRQPRKNVPSKIFMIGAVLKN